MGGGRGRGPCLSRSFDYSSSVEKIQAIQIMSALAQPTRLEVFTQLARARPDGLAAGELAKRVGTPANTMSVHLAILNRAGLISSEKVGRNTIFRAEPDAIHELALFLTRDCCAG